MGKDGDIDWEELKDKLPYGKLIETAGKIVQQREIDLEKFLHNIFQVACMYKVRREKPEDSFTQLTLPYKAEDIAEEMLREKDILECIKDIFDETSKENIYYSVLYAFDTTLKDERSMISRIEDGIDKGSLSEEYEEDKTYLP